MCNNAQNKNPMKPKSRVFCRDCRREKILFETQEKAENFIKFNSGDIEECGGYAPVRSYYCIPCCGWHVTHLQDYNDDRSLTNIVQEKFVSAKAQEGRVRQTVKDAKSNIEVLNKYHFNNIESYVEEIKEHIEFGENDMAKILLRKAYEELQHIWSNVANKGTKQKYHKILDYLSQKLNVPLIKIKG